MTLPDWAPRAGVRTLTPNDLLDMGLTLDPKLAWRAFVLEAGRWGMVVVAWPAKPAP